MDTEARIAIAEASATHLEDSCNTTIKAIVVLMRRAGLTRLTLPMDEWHETIGTTVEVRFTDDEATILVTEAPRTGNSMPE